MSIRIQTAAAAAAAAHRIWPLSLQHCTTQQLRTQVGGREERA